jgi:hypothetical protein
MEKIIATAVLALVIMLVSLIPTLGFLPCIAIAAAIVFVSVDVR